jgi:ABC-type branched-subunit amino acid transport system substrate-binding protein
VGTRGAERTGGPGTIQARTGPLQLGFLNTTVGNAGAFGLKTGQTYEPKAIFLAVVGVMNSAGGIAGRQIVPVIANTDTASASWETDYQAACAAFTQDRHVAAVVGYSFALMDSFESCLTKAGVAHLSGAYAVGDVTTFQQYPYFVGTTNITDDRRSVLQLDAPLRAGVITKSNKLGLMLDDCPPEARAYSRSTAPYIRSRGLNVVATSTLSCVSGASDDGRAAAQIQSAVLQFRTKGVDTIVAEGIPVILFAQEAESQGWHPTFLLTSNTGGAALAPNVPAAQAANMHGYGWLPPVDVDTVHQPAPTAPQKKCLDMLRAKGIVPAQWADYFAAYTTCDALFLYQAALTATAGAADGSSIARAITALGTTYVGASPLDGRTAFGPDRRDAPSEYRPWGWDGGCSCFVYQGAPAVLP